MSKYKTWEIDKHFIFHGEEVATESLPMENKLKKYSFIFLEQ